MPALLLTGMWEWVPPRGSTLYHLCRCVSTVCFCMFVYTTKNIGLGGRVTRLHPLVQENLRGGKHHNLWRVDEHMSKTSKHLSGQGKGPQFCKRLLKLVLQTIFSMQTAHCAVHKNRRTSGRSSSWHTLIGLDPLFTYFLKTAAEQLDYNVCFSDSSSPPEFLWGTV